MIGVLPAARRILGIDPGSRLTGFGIIDADAERTRYVASGAVQSIDGSFPDRLAVIYRSIGEIVREFRPDVVVLESVFVHRNAGSALKLGQARAAALCATFAAAAEVHEFAPREIKQAIVGNGSASKEQVQHMITALLALDGPPSADAADALAAALCYAHRRKLEARLAGISPVAGAR